MAAIVGTFHFGSRVRERTVKLLVLWLARFGPEVRDSISSYIHMPFGVGPRSCIGSRFALLELKLGIARILREFRIVRSANTQVNIYAHVNTCASFKISISLHDGWFIHFQCKCELQYSQFSIKRVNSVFWFASESVNCLRCYLTCIQYAKYLRLTTTITLNYYVVGG